MATKKEKQDLIQALKFAPRDIEIALHGYGGEIAVGRIDEAAYDYWRDRDDLADFAYDWDGDCDHVPADARFITDGCWYDVDDICHENGCEAGDGCYITVDDCLESRTIWESSTDISALDEQGVDVSDHTHFVPEETEPEGTCIFVGQSIEKGTFFSGRVRITQPFDHKKLKISWMDCDGWRLISGVEYAGEEVEGYDGYSTTGKSTEFRVYQVENKAEWDAAAELEKILADIPLIEGEEIWAQEAIDSEPETWNGIVLTKWWPGDFEPIHRGEYEVFAPGDQWPFPQRARWTGRRWVINKKEIEVSRWRGLSQPADKERAG